MDKEEILAKSREENKQQDVYEKEVLREGGSAASVVAALLATVFFIIQIFAGKGQNYGLYAVVFSVPATNFVVKSVRLKRRHEIAVAVMYVLLTLVLAAAHIYQLVTGTASL